MCKRFNETVQGEATCKWQTFVVSAKSYMILMVK